MTDSTVSKTTIKQAKKAYQKRGGQPQISEKERRQLARARELEDRAEAIREKARRKKELAKKRNEVAEKQRQTRLRMGIIEPVDEGYVSPRQTRMKAFFGPAGGVGKPVAANNNNTTTAPADAVESGVDDDGSATACDESNNEYEVSEDDCHALERPDDRLHISSGKAEEAGKEAPEHKTVGEESGSRTFLQGKQQAATQPARLVMQPVDTSLFVDKNDLWAPPSQGSLDHRRVKSCSDVFDGPLPELPFPKPQSFRNDGSLAKEELALAEQIFSSCNTLEIDMVDETVTLPELPTKKDETHPATPPKRMSIENPADIEKMMAEFSSSQLLPRTPVRRDVSSLTDNKCAVRPLLNSFQFSDGLDLSAEEAAHLESNALRAVDTEPKTPLQARDSKLSVGKATAGEGSSPFSRLGDFGGFDFASQDFKEAGL